MYIVVVKSWKESCYFVQKPKIGLFWTFPRVLLALSAAKTDRRMDKTLYIGRYAGCVPNSKYSLERSPQICTFLKQQKVNYNFWEWSNLAWISWAYIWSGTENYCEENNCSNLDASKDICTYFVLLCFIWKSTYLKVLDVSVSNLNWKCVSTHIIYKFCWTAFSSDYSTHSLWHFDKLLQCH